MIATASQIDGAVALVRRAVAHLIEKHGEQSAASTSVPDAIKFDAMLLDEIDEVEEALQRIANGVPEKPGHTVDDELAQVAAVAIAWLASRQTTEATDA